MPVSNIAIKFCDIAKKRTITECLEKYLDFGQHVWIVEING